MTSKEEPKRSLTAQAENSLDLVARYCSDMSRDYPTRISYLRVGDALTYLDKFIQKQKQQQSNPTLSDCIKEWEDRGYIVESEKITNGIYIYKNNKLKTKIVFIRKTKLKTKIKTTCRLFCIADYELLNLIHKTLKALEEMKDE